MRLLLDVPHAPTGISGVCHGPVDGRCPLLDGEGCELFDSADGIVFALDLDQSVNRAVLQAYRAHRPDVPIHVITTPEAAARWSEELAGVEVVTKEEQVTDLLSSVDGDVQAQT